MGVTPDLLHSMMLWIFVIHSSFSTSDDDASSILSFELLVKRNLQERMRLYYCYLNGVTLQQRSFEPSPNSSNWTNKTVQSLSIVK